ncbi:unnamed protein product [Prorocentrum cordatum]|uniref:CSD domain-containing protein n=1 Tax=Prorocentrum cordatum TaxID=2364126 RepID=A0ABN9PWT1_9DINO|nr:unnamed protein product [Polarella glacialis]
MSRVGQFFILPAERGKHELRGLWGRARHPGGALRRVDSATWHWQGAPRCASAPASTQAIQLRSAMRTHSVFHVYLQALQEAARLWIGHRPLADLADGLSLCFWASPAMAHALDLAARGRAPAPHCAGPVPARRAVGHLCNLGDANDQPQQIVFQAILQYMTDCALLALPGRPFLAVHAVEVVADCFAAAIQVQELAKPPRTRLPKPSARAQVVFAETQLYEILSICCSLGPSSYPVSNDLASRAAQWAQGWFSSLFYADVNISDVADWMGAERRRLAVRRGRVCEHRYVRDWRPDPSHMNPTERAYFLDDVVGRSPQPSDLDPPRAHAFSDSEARGPGARQMAEEGSMHAGVPLSGLVKSWNGLKGYGFIPGGQTAEVEGDIMFSRNELPADAREVSDKVLRGRQVQFEGQRGADGRAKATAVALFPVEGYPLPGEIKSYPREERLRVRHQLLPRRGRAL